MSTDTESTATASEITAPEYPERFVTKDAVYTIHSLSFVPSSTPDVGSLFDDPPENIERTWERAQQVGGEISSADVAEVERRLQEARKTVSEVLRKMADRTDADKDSDNANDTS
jgi:hypothetical protein